MRAWMYHLWSRRAYIRLHTYIQTDRHACMHACIHTLHHITSYYICFFDRSAASSGTVNGTPPLPGGLVTCAPVWGNHGCATNPFKRTRRPVTATVWPVALPPKRRSKGGWFLRRFPVYHLLPATLEELCEEHWSCANYYKRKQSIHSKITTDVAPLRAPRSNKTR